MFDILLRFTFTNHTCICDHVMVGSYLNSNLNHTSQGRLKLTFDQQVLETNKQESFYAHYGCRQTRRQCST